MRLSRDCGEADYNAFAARLPVDLQDGWDELERLEPSGPERLYEFLSHAFTRLAIAFHNKEFAMSLESTDFHWWGEAARNATHEKDQPLSTDALEAHARMLLKRQEIEQSLNRKG